MKRAAEHELHRGTNRGMSAGEPQNQRETVMPYRTSVTALMLATALGMMIAEARAWDDAKYVDLKGQWARTIGGAGRYDPSKPLGRLQEAPLAPQYGTGDAGRYDPTKPPGRLQEAPLTPEYQVIHEASLADQAQGGQGDDPTYRCLSPGMPRIMHAYSPMEVVVTPDTTHILIEHIHDNRRIHTDGRDWPVDMDLNPMFAGYSIGRWIDTKGSGRYDTLLVETRGLKGPRTYEASGIPFHADGKTIIKERIYLDSANPNLLNDEITVVDHAPDAAVDDRAELPPCPKQRADLVARGHLRREQRPYRDRQGGLLPQRRRRTDADPQGSAAARSTLFQADAEIGEMSHSQEKKMFGGGWSQGEPPRARVPANEVRSRPEVPQSRRHGDGAPSTQGVEILCRRGGRGDTGSV